MSSFPLIRLDHIPLLQTSILERAMSELKYLYDPGIDAYKQKLQAEIKKTLRVREAADRVERLLRGEEVIVARLVESAIKAPAVLSEPTSHRKQHCLH